MDHGNVSGMDMYCLVSIVAYRDDPVEYDVAKYESMVVAFASPGILSA